METEQKPLLNPEKDLYYAGGPFDKNDPKSLINLMPRECLRALEDVPVNLLFMGEDQLRREVFPSVRLNQIRIAFWKEYDMAHSSLSKMTLKGMIGFLDGLPTIHVRDALQTPTSLAWILCPPMSYDNMLEEALARGLGRINEILSLSFYDTDGDLDPKVVELILKATAFLDVRKHGMPTTRTETTATVNQLSVNVTRRDLKQLGQHSRIEDIDAKIKQLESKMKIPIPEVLDAE
jgi:hypothetical protein